MPRCRVSYYPSAWRVVCRGVRALPCVDAVLSRLAIIRRIYAVERAVRGGLIASAVVMP